MPKFSTFNQFRKSRAREPSNKFLGLVPQQDGSKFSLVSPGQEPNGTSAVINHLKFYNLLISYSFKFRNIIPILIFVFHLFIESNVNKNNSSTLPANPSNAAMPEDCQGEGQNSSDSSWPFRSQSTDRSLIRRSMHMYLESAHNANQGMTIKFYHF